MPNILAEVQVCLKGEAPERFSPNRRASRLSEQFAFFRDAFLSGDRSAMLERLDHSLLVMETLDRC